MKKPRIETGVTKVCTKCGSVKDLCDFYFDRGYRRGACDKCVASAMKANYSPARNKAEYVKKKTENPEKLKAIISNNNLKKKYGITLEAHNVMADAQGGACAICNTVTKLVVDHNHLTDVVRELLCSACNHGIGNAKENPDILDAMKAYLARHNGS